MPEPQLQRTPDDPWLTLRMKRAVALAQAELAIQDAVLAAMVEAFAELRRLVLDEKIPASLQAGALPAGERRRRTTRKPGKVWRELLAATRPYRGPHLTAATRPPDPTAMEQARNVWIAALERYLLPIISAVFGTRAAAVLQTALAPESNTDLARWAQLATVPNRLVEPYWRATLERIARSIDDVFDAIRGELIAAQNRGEAIDLMRNRIGRVLQIDSGSNALREEIAHLEARMFNPHLSAQQRENLFAQRDRVLHDLFLLNGARYRSRGLLRLADVLAARAARYGPQHPDTAGLLAEVDRLRREASALNPTNAAISAVRARLGGIDGQLFVNPDLSAQEITQLADRRRDLYEQLRSEDHGWQYKARRIARTEAMNALNGGTVAIAEVAAQESGETLYKRWLATSDERTRPTHQVADGQTVPLALPFIVGGVPLQRPGDPAGPAEEVINCRCTTEIVDAEEAGLLDSIAPPAITADAGAELFDADGDIKPDLRPVSPRLERTASGELQLNWVEDCGGLPPYIKRIVRHLRGKGMAESRAIAVAVNVVKRMCSTGDLNWPGHQTVNPSSRGEACRAAEQWEALKACAKGRN